MITDVGVGEAAHSVLITRKWLASDEGQEWLQERWDKLNREYVRVNHTFQLRRVDLHRFVYAYTRPTVGRRTCGRRHRDPVGQLQRAGIEFGITHREREPIAKGLDTVDDLAHIPLNWAHRLYLRDWYRVHELPPDCVWRRMPLGSLTSGLALTGVSKQTCLARRREGGECAATNARASEPLNSPWYFNDPAEQQEADQQFVRYKLLCRERGDCRREILFCNIVLRRVVNHSTLAVVQQFPPLLDP